MNVLITFAAAGALLLVLFVLGSRIKRTRDPVGATNDRIANGASGGSGDVSHFELDCGGSDGGGGDGD